MRNFQKISLLSLLATVSWKSQVLGGCGSSKVAPIENADVAKSARSYHVRRTTQTHNLGNAMKGAAEVGTKSSPKASITKEVEKVGMGAGAAAPSSKSTLKIENPGAGAAALSSKPKPTLDARPKREAPATGPRTTTQTQKRKKKQEAATERLSSQGQKAKSTKNDKVASAPTLLRSPLQNGRSRGTVGATPVQSKNKKHSPLAPLSLAKGKKTPQLSRGLASPTEVQKPSSSDIGARTIALVQKGRPLPPLQAELVAITPPEEGQKAAIPITVTSPAEVSGGLVQARGQLLKPLAFISLQAEQGDKDSPVLREVSPPSAPKTPSPGQIKLIESARGQGAGLAGFSLSPPQSGCGAQTPRADSSRPGSARSTTLPTAVASSKAEEGKKERESSPKRLKTMMDFLKSGKTISLGESSADLRLYEQALKDITATTARISTKDFQNNINTLLEILAASPHLKEVSFEDPFDFVYMGGAGKPDVKISLSDIVERLTGSTSLEILSFHGLPREDQLDDFISHFKSFINKFKARKFTVVFKGVSTKQAADREYRLITNSLKTAFTDERITFKMKD